MRFWPLLIVFLLGCVPRLAQDTNVLRLAVTTSTRDSGILDLLISRFETRHDVRVDVVAVGTGAALNLGASGDTDVVLVHARAAEELFMSDGHGIRREEVMSNNFQILGPAADPAEIRALDPSPALHKIASGNHRFVSRGDASGTHQREIELWSRVAQRPNWDGYIESGQGMMSTLVMADQMDAYLLCDSATYLRAKDKLRLVPLVLEGDGLRNPYGIIVVNPMQHRLVNADAAHAFVDFIISPEAQGIIESYEIDGEQLFFPLRLADES